MFGTSNASEISLRVFLCVKIAINLANFGGWQSFELPVQRREVETAHVNRSFDTPNPETSMKIITKNLHVSRTKVLYLIMLVWWLAAWSTERSRVKYILHNCLLYKPIGPFSSSHDGFLMIQCGDSLSSSLSENQFFEK